MQQLSGSDNLFLFSERNNVFNHVACLNIYDISTAPGGQVRYKDILKHFEERIHLHPIFRRRLGNVPLGLDRPYWIEEGDVDTEFHIRHIALPKPGDWRQLMIQVARLHSRPLDRNRPLWEAYVIEGLDNIPKLPAGSFAIFYKFHHASVDGMAGIMLAEKIHSATPQSDMANDKMNAMYVERAPSPIEYMSRAVTNGLGRVVELGKLSVDMANKLAKLGIEQVTEARGPDTDNQTSKPVSGPAPVTRFNAALSPHRVVDGFGMPLSRIKRVRAKVPGASLNDIFLAVSGGGVRKYLDSKGELPEESLRALMPISLRSDASAGGNAIGAGIVRVRSDIVDPLERLRAAHLEAQLGKQQAEKLGAETLDKILSALPSALGNMFVYKVLIPTLNMTVSNVRGPDKPLYVAGAKAMCFYPISVPTDGQGLNITGVSYNGVMWVSAVSCRTMLPDPDFFTQCLRETWEELLAAADALPERRPAKPAGAKKSSRKVPAQAPEKAAIKKTTASVSAAKSPLKKATVAKRKVATDK